ncbi:hypothetical protein RGCCGE502_17595 [Rhizobium grahamii CCGE 502]|uniref:HTH DNA binding domain-containing protein n=1 Tax=Rhizobium grahamii CCGE 502 TaxID=990285 RepID=S3HDL0_9HYPH|nr:hypothetical protein RGCCGE502_17595 [Rhizobium grahamii CCGE 502]
MARQMMERKLSARRTSSKLPELVELVMAKPLVSAGMVAKTLEVTPQAARRIVLEPGEVRRTCISSVGPCCKHRLSRFIKMGRVRHLELI